MNKKNRRKSHTDRVKKRKFYGNQYINSKKEKKLTSELTEMENLNDGNADKDAEELKRY